MIIVIDYGMGNVGSILNMIRKVGGKGVLSRGPEDLAEADKLVLPGVGSFDNGMQRLHALGYVAAMTEKVLGQGVPILGICLGMQLFAHRSEEGAEPGLGWVEAETVRFAFGDAPTRLKIPHMGWNTVRVTQPHPLFPPGGEPPRFYFVHSYHVCCGDPANVLATTSYGIEFTSALVKDNIVGTQFHPEKSHRYGMDLMRHFVHDVGAVRPRAAGRAEGQSAP